MIARLIGGGLLGEPKRRTCLMVNFREVMTLFSFWSLTSVGIPLMKIFRKRSAGGLIMKFGAMSQEGFLDQSEVRDVGSMNIDVTVDRNFNRYFGGFKVW